MMDEQIAPAVISPVDEVLPFAVVAVVGTEAERADQLLQSQLRVTETLSTSEAAVLSRIFAKLHRQTGHDFTHYKRPTILRRLRRRMQSQGIAHISAYLTYLDEHPEELERLHKDFLILVTTFFRDLDTFLALEHQIIPQLFAGKGRHDVVRVWAPGCATGEEAYSLTILLRQDPTLKDSIVIVLTTSNQARDKAAAYNEQIAGYFVKSHIAEDLVDVIKAFDTFWG